MVLPAMSETAVVILILYVVEYSIVNDGSSVNVMLSEFSGYDEDIWKQLLKSSEDNCNVPEQLVFKVFAVTEVLSIDSEKVTDILSPTATELWLSVGDVEETVGEVVSIVKELTDKVLLALLELSETLMVQSL